MGRWREAASEVGRVRAAIVSGGDPALRRFARTLLRTELSTFGPVLRDVLGAEFFPLFWEAWRLPLQMHDDAVEPAAVAAALFDLPTRAPAGRDPEALSLRLTLLTHRAAAWRRSGLGGRARRDLDAALSLAGRREAALGPDRVDAVASQLLVSLAALDVEAGDVATARARLRDALARSPTPELTLDALRRDPTLAGLLDGAR
jgi:hypothetical protein